MKLNFKTFGSGKPLIILHGLLGSLDNWQTLAKRFAKKYTVFTIDLRNHGKSSHSEEFNYQVMLEDLNEFMEDNFISSAHILGHSMGGKVAMYFAMEYPDKIEKLIIADIAPIHYKSGHQIIFDALLSIDLDTKKSRGEVDDQLSNNIEEYGIRQFLMKGLTRNSERKFVWKFDLKNIYANYLRILETFDEDLVYEGRTLFIKGENSNYVLREYREKIKTHFPNYELKIIQNTGHWLHAEKPEDFFKIVDNYLN